MGNVALEYTKNIFMISGIGKMNKTEPTQQQKRLTIKEKIDQLGNIKPKKFHSLRYH